MKSCPRNQTTLSKIPRILRCRRRAPLISRILRSPAFGCYFDLANVVWRGMDTATEIAGLGGLIRQVHIKDTLVGSGDCQPGLGRVDFASSAAALRAIGYDSWLVLETPVAPPEVVARDISFTRSWFPEVGPAGAYRPRVGAFSYGFGADELDRMIAAFRDAGLGAVQHFFRHRARLILRADDRVLHALGAHVLDEHVTRGDLARRDLVFDGGGRRGRGGGRRLDRLRRRRLGRAPARDERGEECVDCKFHFFGSTFMSSTSKTSVAFCGMTGGRPIGPYARSGGIVSTRFCPTFMPAMPWLATGVPFSTNRVGGMFGLFFSADKVESYAQATAADSGLFNRFFHGMLERGVYLAPSAFEAGFMSSAHSDQDIADTLEAARGALRQARG